MKNRVASILLIFALLLSFPMAPAVQARTVESVMPLHTPDGKNFCTAFSINQKDSLWGTAGHCIAVAKDRGYIIMLSGRPIKVVYSLFDSDHDFAVFEVEGVSAPAHKLAETAPRVGDMLHIYGFPYGLPALVKVEGKLAAKNVPVQGAPVSDILDITVAGGNSGSPVLDGNGRLVGILWGGFTQSPHSLSIPWESLMRDIRQYVER